MKVQFSKIVLLALFALAVIAFFAGDFHHLVSLEYLKEHQQSLQRYTNTHLTTSLCMYALGYIIVTALSLPGATLMTLAGGALFGLTYGTIVVSFASSIGATLAFLASRFLFREAVQKRFSARLDKINAGMEREGAFYLFALRLVPAFPFFIINLAMGLTSINTFTFYLVSQIGMLPGTLAYVNAGTRLAEIESLSGILSPAVICSFVILGLLPVTSKKLLDLIRARRSQGE